MADIVKSTDEINDFPKWDEPPIDLYDDEAPARSGPLDTPIAVTFFKSFAGTEKTEEPLSFRALAERIRSTNRARKEWLPWLKLARFGDDRTDKNSYRHDSNVLAITGIEADYDGGQRDVASAIEALTRQGVAAMVYTSPSHTDAAPRWRVLCPLSTELPPDQRTRLLGRLNGLLGGILAGESFTLSQSYYFGSVNHNPAHVVELIDGAPIDQHDDLDKIWIGRPGTKEAIAGTTGPQSGPLDEAALIREITEGKSYHSAMIRLAGHWATDGVGYVEVGKRLHGFMEQVPESARDDRYRARVEDIGRTLLYVFGKRMAEPTPAPSTPEAWPEPDMTVLRLARRDPPPLPLDLFGPSWSKWITDAADAAATSPDYVAANLLAAASSLIGNARWPQATPGWREPPHLWIGTVGDSGDNKSAAADALQRDVLPVIQSRMLGDYPDRLAEWKAQTIVGKAALERWEKDVVEASKTGHAPPPQPQDAEPPEPQEPRLVQSDVTIERVASILATAAPKGLLVTRDELSGWLLGLTSYNDAGRAFWIEAYGGRPYRVERQKLPKPIVVQRLAVSVCGTTQPEKIAEMFKGADDGLLGRFIWAWPHQRDFRLSRKAPNVDWAIEALDRLRLLDLAPDDKGEMRPINVPLDDSAIDMMEQFGRDMQAAQREAGGLLRSAYGKARGLALRLSLTLEMLAWCAADGFTPPPSTISRTTFAAACDMVADYFLPMAARVYGDAAAMPAERGAATLARWIMRERPAEIHVRELQRKVRLPGLDTADAIHAAAEVLVDAGWLRKPPEQKGFQVRPKASYPVNPAIMEATDGAMV